MLSQPKREEPQANHSIPKSPPLLRIISSILRFLLSPLVLLVDVFRPRKKVKPRWVMYNFVLCCLVMILTGLGIIFAEAPTREVLRILAVSNSNRQKLGENLTPNKEVVRAINKYALSNNIDPFLIHAMITHESNYESEAESNRGAKGIMQLKPEVWQDYFQKKYQENACDGEHRHDQPCSFEHCIFKPEDNIRVGVNYLADLIKIFGNVDDALQAYNAGAANVLNANGELQFVETKNYIDRISEFWSNQRLDSFLGFRLQAAFLLKESTPWLLSVTGVLWLIFGLWMWRKGFDY